MHLCVFIIFFIEHQKMAVLSASLKPTVSTKAKKNLLKADTVWVRVSIEFMLIYL